MNLLLWVAHLWAALTLVTFWLRMVLVHRRVMVEGPADRPIDWRSVTVRSGWDGAALTAGILVLAVLAEFGLLWVGLAALAARWAWRYLRRRPAPAVPAWTEDRL